MASITCDNSRDNGCSVFQSPLATPYFQEQERAESPKPTSPATARMRMLGLRRRSSSLNPSRSAVDIKAADDLPKCSALPALNEYSESSFVDRVVSPRPSPPRMASSQRTVQSEIPPSYTATPVGSRPQSRTGYSSTQPQRSSSQIRHKDADIFSAERGVPLPESPLIPLIDADSGLVTFYASSSDGEEDDTALSRDSFASSQTSYDQAISEDATAFGPGRCRVNNVGGLDTTRKDYFSTKSSPTQYIASPPRTPGSLRSSPKFPYHGSGSSSLCSMSRSTSTSLHTPSTSVTTISSSGSNCVSGTFGENPRDKFGTMTTPAVPIRSPRRTPSRNFSRPTLSDMNVPLRRSTGPLNTANAFSKYSSEFNKVNRLERLPSSPKENASPPLSPTARTHKHSTISSNDAASVLLLIMSKVGDFTDLLSLAQTNKGFYGVFNNNKLALVKAVLRNNSPAAWELREASPKDIIINTRSGHSSSDYTPTKYVQFHTRDTYTLLQLRTVIFVRCQALLRPETAAAVREREGDRSKRIDAALWRIWTFCTLFGSGRSREGDIMGQMDWLNGGALARPTTANSMKPFLLELSSAPAGSFGRGNPEGLTADEICDMTEMWNCIKALLAEINGPGRAAQARAYGVFHTQKVPAGNSEAEAAMLGKSCLRGCMVSGPISNTFIGEWVYHLRTLGLSAVLDLAVPSTSSSASVFVVAKSMGWTRWDLAKFGGSRSAFLDDPLSRVYEQRMAVLRSTMTQGQPSAVPESERATPSPDRLTLGPWLQWTNDVEASTHRPQVLNNSRTTTQEKVSLRSRLSMEAFRKSIESPRKSADRLVQRNNPLPLSLFPPEYKHAELGGCAIPVTPPVIEEPRSLSRSMFRSPSRDMLRPSILRSKTSPPLSPNDKGFQYVNSMTPPIVEEPRPVSRSMFRAPSRDMLRPSILRSKTPPSLIPEEDTHGASGIPPVPAIPAILPIAEEKRPASRSMFRAPSRDMLRPAASRSKTSPASLPPSSYRAAAVNAAAAKSDSSRPGSAQKEGRPSTSSSIGSALASIMERGFSRDEAKSVFHRTGDGVRADVSRALASLFDRKGKKEAR